MCGAKRLQLALHLLFLSTQKDTRMNQAFQAAAAAYKFAPTLTHKQEVMRMYRRYAKVDRPPCLLHEFHHLYRAHIIMFYSRSLRLVNSWAENREVFNEEALKIREEFNQNKNHTGKAPFSLHASN